MWVDVSIALNRLVGAFEYEFRGNSATKKCICIPEDKLYVDKNGAVWLQVQGIDDTKFERQTHSLKQRVSKEDYDALPVGADGRKVPMPFIGSIKTTKGARQTEARATAPTSVTAGNTDDLPF